MYKIDIDFARLPFSYIWFKYLFIYTSVINLVLFSYFSYQPQKIYYRKIFFQFMCKQNLKTHIYIRSITHKLPLPFNHLPHIIDTIISNIHECSISHGIKRDVVWSFSCFFFFFFQRSSALKFTYFSSLGIKYILFFFMFYRRYRTIIL